jgi:Tol biopolymer transport system component
VHARWDGGGDGGDGVFSPDGEWIGLVGHGLSRVSVRGGTPTRIADLDSDTRFFGANWGPNDRVVVTTDRGLHSVSADGGPVELLVTPDAEQGELSFSSPEILPGGKTVLFTVLPSDHRASPHVAAYDFETRQRRVVLPLGEGAIYSATGHLLYATDGRLHAVAFDPDTLETRGAGQAVLEEPIEGANFDVSDTGTLVYQPQSARRSPNRLVWVDRGGREEPLSAPPHAWVYPRLSPDGKRVVADLAPSTRDRDIYILDIERETLSRLTNDPDEDLAPYWSADGRSVFFSSGRGGSVWNLYVRAADGTGRDELFFQSDTGVGVSVSGRTPDGRQLILNADGVVAIDVEEPRQSHLLLREGSIATVSPEGRWVAYQSGFEGQEEVYVGPYPDLGSRRETISSGGGRHPLWSPRGDELLRRPHQEHHGRQGRARPDLRFRQGDRALSQPERAAVLPWRCPELRRLARRALPDGEAWGKGLRFESRGGGELVRGAAGEGAGRLATGALERRRAYVDRSETVRVRLSA